jgi:hypothetical protein
MCMEVNCVGELIYLPPPSLPKAHTYAHIRNLNIRSEADRRKHSKCSVSFMDPNQMAAAGF